MPGEVVDLRFQITDLLGHAGTHFGNLLPVELHADPLHRRQHPDQGLLDLLEELHEAGLFEAGLLGLGEVPDRRRPAQSNRCLSDTRVI